MMDIIYNDTTQKWEIKKEPYATIEVDSEEDFEWLTRAMDFYMAHSEAQPVLYDGAFDAVPVVRCKDCEYAYINSFSMASGVVLCRHWTNRADGIRTIMQQDDYCSYGERRE